MEEVTPLLAKSIDYTKTAKQLAKNPKSRMSALLLQSLRQQLTRASSVKQSNLVMGIFAENDLLSLKIRKNVILPFLVKGLPDRPNQALVRSLHNTLFE